MIVVIRKGSWQLINAPQSVTAAWRLADKLTAETGIPHSVGRV